MFTMSKDTLDGYNFANEVHIDIPHSKEELYAFINYLEFMGIKSIRYDENNKFEIPLSNYRDVYIPDMFKYKWFTWAIRIDLIPLIDNWNEIKYNKKTNYADYIRCKRTRSSNSSVPE